MKHIAIALALLTAVPLASCATTATDVGSVEMTASQALLGLDAAYHLAVNVVVDLPDGPAKDHLKALGATAGSALKTAHTLRTAASITAAAASVQAFSTAAGAK